MSSFAPPLTSRRELRVPLLPLAVAAYASIAAIIAPQTYVALLGWYARETVVVPALVIVGLIVAGIIASPRAPGTFIVSVLARNGVRFVLIFAGFCAGLAAFTTLKIAIPSLVPFYADPILADIDALIHFGNPGEHIHALLPQWLQYPLAYLYGPMWFLLWFGLTAFVALHDSKPLRQRYFWTMALSICLLGSVLAIALSSVGPVFYEAVYQDDRFAPLMAAVGASPAGPYMSDMFDYLYGNYLSGGHALGTGISAMPSVHLAIVTLNALMLTTLNRYVGAAAWVYVVLIVLGSAFLGWHYAIDGYVSIAVVSLIWWTVGRILDRRAAGTTTSAV
jgi:hypothetical protein